MDEARGHRYIGVLAGDKVALIIWRKDDSVGVADFTQRSYLTTVVAAVEQQEAPWKVSVLPIEVVWQFRRFYLPEEHWDLPALGIVREMFRWQGPKQDSITEMLFCFKNGALEAILLEAPDLVRKRQEEYWRSRAISGNNEDTG